MTTTADQTSTGHPTRLEAGLDSGLEVLRFARSQRAIADAAEAQVLVAAVTWAEQHPPESIALAATWKSGAGDTGLPLAGPGAPLVSEFCIAELALALRLSTDAGRALIAHGVELKYRLPKTWTRVVAGDLPVWRARRVAERTLLLTREAAASVDGQVAPFAHKIGVAALERLVEETIARLMPQVAEEHAAAAADLRHVTFHHDQVNFDGTTSLEAELDLADALDLDAAITRGAATLKACGSEDPLDVRRAIAVGEIARRQLALDLNAPDPGDWHEVSTSSTSGGPVSTGSTNGGPDPDNATRPPSVEPVETTPADHNEVSTSSTSGGPDSTTVKPRQVVLYVHLSEAALTGTSNDLHLARVENQRRVLTVEQIRTWCANPDTQVIVKPVIDLNHHHHVEAYEVPDRLAEQAELRDHTCVFPWCTRPARSCDHDHVIAHDPDQTGDRQPGPTCSCNIAPLCRRHHRLKTHSPWTYTVLEPGSYLWTSPHGYQFLRDHTGTLDVSPDRASGPASHADRPASPHPPDQ